MALHCMAAADSSVTVLLCQGCYLMRLLLLQQMSHPHLQRLQLMQHWSHGNCGSHNSAADGSANAFYHLRLQG